ncbi:MAG: hypothetical protein ACK5JF_00785 [Oscillospiraceae bacterium]
MIPAEQTDLKKILHYQKRISAALTELDPDTEIAGTPLQQYQPWASVEQIPVDQLPYVCRHLEGEVKARKFLGDAQYFDTRTAAAKCWLYINAAYALLDTLADSNNQISKALAVETDFATYKDVLTTYFIEASPLPRPAPATKKAAAKRGKKATPKAGQPKKRFVPPAVDEVAAYATEKSYNVDAESFVGYYASVGWMVSRNKRMVDWQAAVSNWHHRDKKATEKLQQSGMAGKGINAVPMGKAPDGDILAFASNTKK